MQITEKHMHNLLPKQFLWPIFISNNKTHEPKKFIDDPKLVPDEYYVGWKFLGGKEI